MIYLSLFIEFFKIGLFSMGGGSATLPFLFNLIETHHWFTETELLNMIAVSESTPGPLGANMATFAGFRTAGLLGALVSTTALVLPAFIIIPILSKFLKRFKKSRHSNIIFCDIRLAVVAMVSSVILRILWIFFGQLSSSEEIITSAILFVCYLILIIRYKRHPIFYIILAAFMGLLI